MDTDEYILLLPHNIPVYEELMRKMKKVNRCAVTAATGTGKTYIGAKYAKEQGFEKDTLILVPNLPVSDGWKKLLPKAIIITYQRMLSQKPDFSDFRLIICDEMHHLGARQWGTVFHELTRYRKHKILGLTATPIRYKDKKRNMVEEFFQGNEVKGIQFEEAIRTEVLPSFDYIAVTYNIPNTITDTNLQGCALSGGIEIKKSQESYCRIMHKYLKNTKAYMPIKAIVFVSNIAQIEDVKNICQKEFPSAWHLQAHSRQTEWKNQNAFTAFENATHNVFLYVVSILNEGRHLKGANVEILFRKTRSPICYLQQLGRVLDSSNQNKKVIILDFAENYTNLRRYAVGKPRKVKNRPKPNPERQTVKKDFAISQNELFFRMNIMEEKFLKPSNAPKECHPWTEEELDLIRRYLEINPSDRIPLKNWQQNIPAHSFRSVQKKIYDICEKEGYEYRRTVSKWRAEEIEIIRDYIKKDLKERETIQELAERLPAHTYRSVKLKVQQEKKKTL